MVCSERHLLCDIVFWSRGRSPPYYVWTRRRLGIKIHGVEDIMVEFARRWN